MKKILAIILISGVTQPLLSQDTTAQKLDELVEAYAKQNRFNGSVLVARHGKILLEKGYGIKSAQNHTLNDANTIFQIASVTKQFTSAIILKLVELKKMSLTDKLSKYYPDFPKGDSITIENLLTHTSGIYDYTNETGFMDTGSVKPANESKMLALFKTKDFDFSPGTNWSYSNSGYSLLGYIIQKLTKMRYDEAVRKYIFTPLKMNNSGFDFTHLANNEKAVGYSIFSENVKKEAPIVDSSVSFAAGAIFSTVGDLYKWHEGLEKYKIISKELLAKAYTPFKNNYGYGWIIDSLFGKRIISHSGGIYGFRSNIARAPEDDVCIVLLNNNEIPNLAIITKKIFAILYNEPYKLPAKNEMKLSDELLKKYAGSYEMGPGMVIQLTLEDGHLMATTDHKEEMYAQKENHFLVDGGSEPVEVEFERDEAGIISDLFFYKNGKKIVCKKIR